jgi:small-conductance mechanosensitive channel
MIRTKNLPLRSGELVVEIIKPTTVHNFLRFGFGFFILLVNSFFTFWLWQKGIEGQIFYGVVFTLGIYLISYGILFDRSNYLVVTNERIFDIHRESLFSETLATLSFTDLVDVVVVKKGFLPTILNYGLITLHPRDGKYTFEIEKVPKPGRVQNLLFERKEAASRNNQYLTNSALLKQVLKIVPDLSEAELTLLYQRVNGQLQMRADEIDEIKEEVV